MRTRTATRKSLRPCKLRETLPARKGNSMSPNPSSRARASVTGAPPVAARLTGKRPGKVFTIICDLLCSVSLWFSSFSPARAFWLSRLAVPEIPLTSLSRSPGQIDGPTKVVSGANPRGGSHAHSRSRAAPHSPFARHSP